MIPYEIFTSETRTIISTTKDYIYAVEKIMIDEGYWISKVIYTCEDDLVLIEVYKLTEQEKGF